MKAQSKKRVKLGRPGVLTKYQRENMIEELAGMVLKNAKRKDLVEHIVKKYGYSVSTTNDIICEAQQCAAKKFTNEEVEIAKRQIKELTETIMFDEDEISLSKLRAAELLGRLMKAFNPDIAIQNNITNLNLSNLTLEELKMLLSLNDEK